MDGDETAKRKALEIFESLGARPIIEKLKQQMYTQALLLTGWVLWMYFVFWKVPWEVKGNSGYHPGQSSSSHLPNYICWKFDLLLLALGVSPFPTVIDP